MSVPAKSVPAKKLDVPTASHSPTHSPTLTAQRSDLRINPTSKPASPFVSPTFSAAPSPAFALTPETEKLAQPLWDSYRMKEHFVPGTTSFLITEKAKTSSISSASSATSTASLAGSEMLIFGHAATASMMGSSLLAKEEMSKEIELAVLREKAKKLEEEIRVLQLKINELEVAKKKLEEETRPEIVLKHFMNEIRSEFRIMIEFMTANIKVIKEKITEDAIKNQEFNQKVVEALFAIDRELFRQAAARDLLNKSSSSSSMVAEKREQLLMSASARRRTKLTESATTSESFRAIGANVPGSAPP